MDMRMEKPGFSLERPPAALQPARRLSWLASERAHLCISLLIQSRLVRCLIACVHQSVPTAGWGGILEHLQFYGMREGVLGEFVVRARVRAYAAKELRFSGMIPSQRL